MGHGGIQSGLVLCDFLSAGRLAVSLFGQELGTADKVSAKRLEEVGEAGLHPPKMGSIRVFKKTGLVVETIV